MATVWHHREKTEASPLVAILVAYSYSLFEYVYSLELKKEELENVNGGVGCKKKFGIRRNGKDDWDW